MNNAQLLKDLAPFLDPHILLKLLETNCQKTSKALQDQIRSKLPLVSDKSLAKKTEEDARKEASNILSLLENQQECQKLKQQRLFTLEKLGEKKIYIEDCQSLFALAKVLYESGKSILAEKYLFSLKEILVNEGQNHADLVMQVYWGLLACEILNSKERDVLEHTTLKKIKEIIERRTSEGHDRLDNINQYAWVLNWILVYGYMTGNHGLFSSLISDHQTYGSGFLNIIQIRCQHIQRYMVASFLLSRHDQMSQKHSINRNALQSIALPIIQEEKEIYSDNFTQFLQTLFEEYDFDRAIELALQLEKDAKSDILLQKYASDIKRQALLLVYQTKVKVQKNVSLDEITSQTGLSQDDAVDYINQELMAENLQVKLSDDKKSISTTGQENNLKTKIKIKTIELINRTQELNRHYTGQVSQIQFVDKAQKESKGKESAAAGTAQISTQ